MQFFFEFVGDENCFCPFRAILYLYLTHSALYYVVAFQAFSPFFRNFCSWSAISWKTFASFVTCPFYFITFFLLFLVKKEINILQIVKKWLSREVTLNQYLTYTPRIILLATFLEFPHFKDVNQALFCQYFKDYKAVFLQILNKLHPLIFFSLTIR